MVLSLALDDSENNIPAATNPQTQDVNWKYIRRSEDVQDFFWTSYVRSIYVCVYGV